MLVGGRNLQVSESNVQKLGYGQKGQEGGERGRGGVAGAEEL